MTIPDAEEIVVESREKVSEEIIPIVPRFYNLLKYEDEYMQLQFTKWK